MDRDINYHMATATFYIDMVAAGNRSTYKGAFEVKCLISPLELIRSDALYRKLLGDTNPNYASDYVGSLSYALSQLKYRVVSSPAWYSNGTDIDGSHIDDAILLKIFDDAIECEAEYRLGIDKKYLEAKKSVVEAVDDGTLTDGKSEKVEEEGEGDEI